MGTLLYSETIQTRLALALMLRDGFTQRPQLFGDIDVSVPDVEQGYRKPLESTFLFYTLAPGSVTIRVRSKAEPPLYLDRDISITLPMADPQWPAFPDRSVANPALPFDSVAQTPLFRSQYLESLLLPSPSYPFPADTSLIRGIVSSSAGPLDDVSILVSGQELFRTSLTGEYVVPVEPYRPNVTLTFSRPLFSDAAVNAAVSPHSTTVVNVVMTP
jgi:hypothetical protein